jgi:hypothetical protein
VNRADWQQLAEDRILDAEVLLAAGRWSGAYYLAGYAVEAALKACVVARVAAEPGVIFESKKFGADCWTHDLEKLVALAELKAALVADLAVNQSFARNWTLVKDWTEESRYLWWDERTARAMLGAINDQQHGVLQWVRVRW